jgi:hypothetical protein
VFRPGHVVNLARIDLRFQVEHAAEGVATTHAGHDLGVRVAAALGEEQARQGADERVTELEKELGGNLEVTGSGEKATGT